MTGIMRPDGFESARDDYLECARLWRLWTLMAWHDLASRYKRTLLGPLWIASGLATLVMVMSVIYPRLFGASPEEFVPHLTLGFVAWFFINAVFGDGCYTYINAAGVIKQQRLPLTMFAALVGARSLIVFLHNLLVYAFVGVYFQIHITLSASVILLTIVIYAVASFFLAIILGIMSARYRDLPIMIGSTMQALFFLTPVFWRPSALGDTRPLFVDLNPFYHFIEILRAPLLGQPIELLSWIVVGITLVFLALLSILLVAQVGRRVVFWI